MTTGKALNGKSYAGNPHVRFDEGEIASAATPRRGSLLCKRAIHNVMPHSRDVWNKLNVLLATVAASVALPAATLYTNTWSNTEGVSVVKNFGDAANWSVAYEPGVVPPASAVPTADSKTLMKRSASVTLRAGDDIHLGNTYFLADGTRNLTLNLTIPTGSSLALDGTDTSSHMNTSSWVDGGTKNKVTIDVDGGSFVLGQKVFNMRGNTDEAWNNVPVNHITVHNGGTMYVTNGYVRLWGGSSALSDGKGLYTNIVDVLEGSTLYLTGSGRIAFGSNHNHKNGEHYDDPWIENYHGGGWVNVKGGKIVVKDSTIKHPIVINGHASADMGACLNVTDGGMVDLGGKCIYIGAKIKKAPVMIGVSGGGVITNGHFSVQDGADDFDTSLCIDVNNGKIFFDQFLFGTTSGIIKGRPTIRIHGGDSIFTFNGWAIHGSQQPIFADMRLKAHTDRTADFPIRPIQTRKPKYETGGSGTTSVPGYWRLSPDGGLQLVHKNSFELLCRKHDSQGDYSFDTSYGGLIGEEMWMTNCTYLYEDRWTRYTTYRYAYVYRVSLKDESKLEDGVALAQPKPRGWLQLPSFTAREVDPGKMKRISVRLDLVAPEGGELDLDGVVEKMRTEGGQDAYKDSNVAGYNVRVDLPINELMANTTDDKIVMDFVVCDLYSQAAGVQPMMTNALIRAATCEKEPLVRGSTIIVY